MKKVLVVVSNHPPERWAPEQKASWDEIIYIPHPEVDPRLSKDEVYSLVEDVYYKIRKTVAPLATEADIYFNVQGEYAFTFLLLHLLYSEGVDVNKFVWPTTERVTEEKIQPDGTVVKTQVFKFVRWR